MAKDAKKNKDVKKRHFFKDFKVELKRVVWPTFKQVVNNTKAVIAIVLIIAAIVFALDVVFDLFNEYGINKLKSNIKNKVVQTTEQNLVDTNNIVVENNVIDNTVQNESLQENVQ